MDPPAYLQPGFDPATLTVAKLRSVLLDNNVQYAASATKGTLVDLFNSQVKPKASQLLRDYEGVVASSEGIVVMDKAASRATSVKSSPKKATRSPKKASKTFVEPEEDEGDVANRSFSSDNVFQVDSPVKVTRSPKKTAKSPKKTVLTPAKLPARSLPKPFTRMISESDMSSSSRTSSQFSSNNVFQSKPPSSANDHTFVTSSDGVPFSLAVPRKRRQTGASPQKELKRKKKSPDNSVNDSDSSMSDAPRVAVALSGSPKKRVASLDIAKFEESSEADGMYRQYLKTPSGIEVQSSPRRGGSSRGSSILNNYSKSVGTNGKVLKRHGNSSKKLKKALERLKRETEKEAEKEKENAPVLASDDTVVISEAAPEVIPEVIPEIVPAASFPASSPEVSFAAEEEVVENVENIQLPTSIDVLSGPTTQIDSDEDTVNSADEEVVEKKHAEAAVASDGFTDTSGDSTQVEIEVEKTSEVAAETKAPLTEKPVKKKSAILGAFSVISKIILALFVAAGVFVFGYFRAMKLNAGYCGVPNTTQKSLELWSVVPVDWQQTLEPAHIYVNTVEEFLVEKLSPYAQCQSCPEHGTCYADSQLVCERGYTKQWPLASVFGLVPNEEDCVFDEYADKKAELLTRYTLELLKHRKGKKFSASELHNLLRATKPDHMTNEEFEVFWDQFINYDILQEPEITVDFKTGDISIEHKTPSQYLTRSLGDSVKSRQALYDKSIPTSTFEGYTEYQDPHYKRVELI